MKNVNCKAWLPVVICVCSGLGFSAETLQGGDLRDAAPPDAYLAVYGMHNPERDYQKQHYQAVWNEIQSSKIAEKILQIVESRIGEGDAEQFLRVRDVFRAAIAPIEWDKLANHSESLYIQRFETASAAHVLLVRIPDGGAESLKTAIVNLFNLAAGASRGSLTVGTDSVAGVEMNTLQLPGEAANMFQPSVGVKDDVAVFTTSRAFAQEALERLENPSANSKFDEPRVIEALSHLPVAEDAVVVFDGKQMAMQLQGIPKFIQQVSGGRPEAQRAAGLLTEIFQQMDAFDIEVTVQFTEEFKNRTASFGRLSKAADTTVLGKMLTKQQLFENWTELIPSSTTGFSMSGGCNMQPLYTSVMEMISAKLPEAQPGLDGFAAIQNQFDLHLKEDLFDAFSGEMISVTSPGPPTPFGKGSQSVMMIRCSRPDRIQELLHRGLNALNQIPQVKGQGISLSQVNGLEGFEELKAQALGMTGLRPVIGFRDGWMIMGSHAPAVEAVFATQSGSSESWSDSDRFKQFGLTIEGPVESISYKNTGENIRGMAQGLQQAGMFAPMMLGMLQSQNQGGRGPDLQIFQDLLGLLPSMGRIVAKFDFIDATLSVTQPGSEAGTYMRQSVTLVRPPKTEKPASTLPPSSRGNNGGSNKQ